MRTMPAQPPPSYQESVSGPTGFPQGYFIIRSRAPGGRVLDVSQSQKDDGTEVILWPEREQSWVDPLRDPSVDNQVFFIDYNGALCSRDSGHAIDVENGCLVLRHRRPVTLPYPNAFSHPLPVFEYSSRSGEIAATFLTDPSYSPSSANRSSTWENTDFVLVSIPTRRPRSLLDSASDLLSSAASTVLSPLSFVGISSPAPIVGDEAQHGEFSLRQDELLDEDLGDQDDDPDDSPDSLRRVRIIATQRGRTSNLSSAARARRSWEVIPLLNEKTTTGRST